jgi:hypothetical protein
MADQDEDTGQDIVIEQEGEEEEQKVFVSTTDDDETRASWRRTAKAFRSVLLV